MRDIFIRVENLVRGHCSKVSSNLLSKELVMSDRVDFSIIFQKLEPCRKFFFF